MADDEFDRRLDQLKRVLEVVTTIEGNTDLQNAAFAYMFGTSTLHTRPPKDHAVPPADAGDGGTNAANDDVEAPIGNGKSKSRRTRKVASVPQDKSVNLSPEGKQSWVEFVAEKKPSSHEQKYTVCVFWLLEIAGFSKATINQVVSQYLAAKWALPSNPRNMASKTSNSGYIDSKDQSDLKLTSQGTALVANQLLTK